MCDGVHSFDQVLADQARPAGAQAGGSSTPTGWPHGEGPGWSQADGFRGAFENSPLGMVLAALDDRIILANRAFCRMLEYTPAELCSLKISDVTHPDDWPADREAALAVAAGQLSVWRLEKRYITKSGRVVWGRLTANVVPGHKGQAMALGIVEDITSARDAKQAMDRSERRHQLILDNAGDVICTIDAKFQITSMSRSVKEILGYEPGELVGRPLGTVGIVPPEILPRIEKGLQQALWGSAIRTGRYVFRNRLGLPVHMAVRASPLPGPAAVPEAVVVMHDVTEQVLAHQALRESEENYRHLIEQAMDGILILQDEIIRFVNPQIARVLEYSQQEMIGTHYSQYLKPEHLSKARHYLADRLTDRDPSFLVMTKLLGRHGRYIDMEGSVGRTSFGGQPAVLVILRDATQRKATEDALRRSENLLSSIIEQSPVSMWIADGEGTNIRQNEACRRLFGIRQDDQTVGVYNLFKDDVLIEQGLIPKIREVFEQGQMVQFRVDYDVTKVHHVRVPGGTHRLLDVTIFPIKDGRGKVVNAVVQHNDVTELHQREDQLRQAQKLEAVGKLAGGVAHDFRNQLTVVNGYCELLLARLADDDPSREAIQEVYSAAQRSTALTSQLLAYSRKQVLQPQPIHLNNLIREMQMMLTQAVGHNIQLSLDLAKDLWQIEADPNQTQQVIMNIALNARDAMPDGGNLFVHTCNERLDETYVRRHNGSVPGPHVRLTITDTGVGMDEDTRKRMFDPFFTTKPVGKGTGLGLSTVYGFVRQSGGHICVRSHPGQGTRLRVHFPSLDLVRRLRGSDNPQELRAD